MCIVFFSLEAAGCVSNAQSGLECRAGTFDEGNIATFLQKIGLDYLHWLQR